MDVKARTPRKARKEHKTQAEIKLYHIVIFNLLENGYLEANNEPSPFVRLTEKGYNHMQGDDLVKNEINLKDYINISDNNIDCIYNELWTIIGKENVAPFYVDGVTFFNTINPFVNISINYSTYIKELSDRKESTSRISWFKTLFKQLGKSDIPAFLEDLSLNIQRIYSETDETNQDNAMEINTILPVELEGKKIEVIKKVFITYCWENEEHNKWVHKLASDLGTAGFDVDIDIKQPLGIELNRFMEQTISNVDKVLIIATPEYKRRADNRERGVGYETSLITDDLIREQNRIKFIPIIRKGSKDTAYPLYLGNRKGLPMRDEDNYEEALNELISNIRNY